MNVSNTKRLSTHFLNPAFCMENSSSTYVYRHIINRVCSVCLRWFGKFDCHHLGECFACCEDTTFNTGKFPNPHLVWFSVQLCWHKWNKQMGCAQCVKPMTTGSALDGHEGRRCTSAGVGIAQPGAEALHNHKAQRCTEYFISADEEFCRDCALRGPPPAAVQGELPAAFAKPLPCDVCLEKFQTLQFPLLVISITPPRYTQDEGQLIPCKI